MNCVILLKNKLGQYLNIYSIY